MEAPLARVLAADGASQEACIAEEISEARPDAPGSYDPEPGQTNASWPILELRPISNGTALVRMLMRVLVRRALIQEGVIRIADDCTSPTRAG